MSTVDERPKLINALPMSDKKVKLFYENGEVKMFDVKPFLNSPLFAHLKDEKKFQVLIQKKGYIAFDDRTDFSPQILYDDGVSINA